MPTPIWLTDEDSEVAGFKRAKIPFTPTQVNKSDCPSLVRAITQTVAGPATIPITSKVGGLVFNEGWLTDPLSGPDLSNGVWVLHAWTQVDDVAAHVALQFQVRSFGGPLVVNASSGPLGTMNNDVALTTGPATPQSVAKGNRLLIQLNVVDSGTMVAGHQVTLSYNGLYSRCEGDTWVQCPDNLTVIGSQQGAALVGDIPDDDVLAIRTILRDFSSQIGLSYSPSMDDSEIIRYIIQAVETYSVDRPYTTGYYYIGDGNTWDFPLPPKWIWQFSRIVSIEYPTDTQYTTFLETRDWEVRNQVLGQQPLRALRLKHLVMGNNEKFLVQYSTRHLYSTEFSTIPKEDLDAVLWLGASYCAAAMSSKFAGATDSTLEADVVNYRDSQRKWSDVAVYLKGLYLNRVVNPDSAVPVGSTDEWNIGRNSLWHFQTARRQRT